MMQHKSRAGGMEPAGPALSEPRYQALADRLEADMATGKLAGGQRIAGENALAVTFGVSRVTVRAALAILERKGLVVRRAGAGTFVAPPRRLHHDLAVLENLFGQFARQGIRTERKTLEFRWSPVDAETAHALGYAEAMFMRRVWYVDEKPFAVTESYLHPTTRSVARAVAECTPAYAILEKLGHHVATADLTLRADTAGRRFAAMLGTTARMPVLILQRTSFSDANEPLERTTCFARSDALEFSLSVHGSARTTPSLQPLPLAATQPRPARRSPKRAPARRPAAHRRGANA